MSDRQRGRPSKYTPELAATICERLGAGESLRSVCATEGMPSFATVSRWAIEDREGFSVQYANARRVQALRWADEILSIADDSSRDTYETDEGTRTDHEVIQRSRLRVDTRKWLLSKVLPKVYGERLAHEISGPDGKPIETRDVSTLTDEQLSERLAQVRNRLLGVMPSVNGNGNGSHG